MSGKVQAGSIRQSLRPASRAERYLSRLRSVAAEGVRGDSIFGRRTEDRCDVLIVLPPFYLNLRSRDGLIADKTEALRLTAERRGARCVILTHPYSAGGAHRVAGTTIGVDALELTVKLKDLLRLPDGPHRSPDESKSTSRSPDLHAQMWRHVLDRMKPKLVVGINLAPGLCRSARARGVPVVEAQHGLVGVWFGQMLQRREAESRPTHMLTWDLCYESVARDAGLLPITTGYPRLIDTARLDTQRVGQASDLRERPAPRVNAPSILVPLQYRFQDSPDPFGIISSSVYEAMCAIRAQMPESRLVIRLHPVYERLWGSGEAEHWLTKEFPGCVISAPSHAYILDEIERCDALVTHHSSTVFEAALMGVPTVLLGTVDEVDTAGAENDDPEANDFRLEVDSALLASGMIRMCAPANVPAVLSDLIRLRFAPYVPTLECTLEEALGRLGV